MTVLPHTDITAFFVLDSSEFKDDVAFEMWQFSLRLKKTADK